jgi:N utilization substance protein B
MSEPSELPESTPAPDVPTPNPAENAKAASKRNRGNKRSKASGQAKPRERVAPGGPRHLARITAMQVLYEIDVADHAASVVLARTFEDPDLSAEDEGPAGDALAAVRERVERLVRGVMENFREIDPYIAEAAPAFPIVQLPAVDRNVLRLAIYELLHEADVPPKAAINEAVELAKRFGGENSSRFVNGVLGTIASKIETAQKAGTPAPAETSVTPESPETSA